MSNYRNVFGERKTLGVLSGTSKYLDIYGLFDHIIAHEIRLQKVLEENLLCPVHYFGSTDIEIDGTAFMRPSMESVNVFVKQLGCGPRKADEKEYMVILDFIGKTPTTS